jgi:hypothetical protein
VHVSRVDASIASVEMLVDGERLRPEHHLYVAGESPAAPHMRPEHRDVADDAEAVSHTFTFDPADLGSVLPTQVEIAIVARDTEADPTATDPEAPNGGIGISVERFRIGLANVSVTGGNLGFGWAGRQATVAFDATHNAGVREARLLIDDVSAGARQFPCDYTKAVPCPTMTNGESPQTPGRYLRAQLIPGS